MQPVRRVGIRAGGRLLILTPEICDAPGADAEEFIAGLLDRTGKAADVLRSDGDLGTAETDDVIVLLAPTDPRVMWRGSVERFLERSRRSGADVMPILLHGRRTLPPPLEEQAASRVSEVMRTYQLAPFQFFTAGAIMAREALSHLWPTYAKSRLQLFLSYRGSDGEDVGGRLADAILRLRHEPLFDLIDLTSGADVKPGITGNLRKADALIFCDTPDAAANFAWMKAEMCVALTRGLPIIWLRVDQVGQRSDLPVKPNNEPDFDVVRPGTPDEYIPLARDLIDAAFVGAHSEVHRMESCLANVDGPRISLVDGRNRLFLFSRPRRWGPFELTDRVLIQAFARRPERKDGLAFRRFMREREFVSADGRLSSIGAGALVSPLGEWSQVEPDAGDSGTGPPVYYASAQSLLSELESAAVVPVREGRGPELLILAAFAPGAGARANFIAAIQAVARLWLSRRGRIRFGGHPTATPLIDSVAKDIVTSGGRPLVTAYQSEHFETPDLLADYLRLFEVVSTPDLGSGEAGRAASLTLMRERMVTDGDVDAAILIGGRIREESGRAPGVAEEMLLVRQRDVPLFVLGGTGGQAAIIANESRTDDPPFARLGNPLSVEDNLDLARTDRYERAARIIWEAVAGT